MSLNLDQALHERNYLNLRGEMALIFDLPSLVQQAVQREAPQVRLAH